MRVGRQWVLATLATAAAVLPACGGDESAAMARAHLRETAGEDLKIAGIPEDGKLLGNVATLELTAADIEIVEPDGDTSGRTAHFVVFVDREPGPFGTKVPDERDVIETAEGEVTIPGFTPGSHTLVLALADGAHRLIGDSTAEAAFTVTSPTLRATANATSPAKEPVVITVAVQGATVKAPDGTPATDGGHLDVFVDREPTAVGAPVPVEAGILHVSTASIEVSDLPNGEHELWVMLVRGDETPFDPMVADKVVVEVG